MPTKFESLTKRKIRYLNLKPDALKFSKTKGINKRNI